MASRPRWGGRDGQTGVTLSRKILKYCVSEGTLLEAVVPLVDVFRKARFISLSQERRSLLGKTRCSGLQGIPKG